MANELMDSDIVDLQKSTLKDLGPLKFNQIATKLQRYEVMSRIMRKEKVQFEGGNGIQRTIMIDDSGAARDVGLHSVDSPNIVDVLAQIDIPWKHTESWWGYERRELLVNRGPSKIVDLMKVRRTASMIALASHMENRFWGKPADTTDKLKIFGVLYWLTYNATVGFNGGNATGFTAGPANLDSTTYPRWKNFSGQYTNVSKLDLIKTMRTAKRKTNFESPVDISDYRRGSGDQYRIYVNETTISAFEDVGESQNENLGRDIASMDGTITFKRNPIIWIPKLDEGTFATACPVLMIDWGQFYPVFLKGDYLRETDAMRSPTQHNSFVTYLDLTWNLLCTDRRAQTLLAKSDPAA